MKMTNIKIMGIAHNSVVDGVGIRDVIFTAGCPHHCYCCHNPETWNINNGKDYTIQNIIKEKFLRRLLFYFKLCFYIL